MSTYPKKIYRYRSLQKNNLDSIKNTVQRGEIFFSKPSSFNDPFDCRANFLFDVTDDEIHSYFTKLVKKYHPELNWKERQAQRTKRLSDWKTHPRNPEFVQKLSEIHTKQLIEDTGIACFSETRDSILMWSHYADSHKGICIEFSGIEKYFEDFHEVKYSKNRLSLNPITQSAEEMLERALLTKSEEWSYEKEWRAIQYRKGSGIYKIPESCITGLILGSQISIEDEETIKTWALERDELKIYRANISLNKFEINVQQEI